MPVRPRLGCLAVALIVAACSSTTSPSPAPVASPTAASPTPTASPSATPGPSPSVTPNDLVAADLDGMMVASDLAHRLPIAVSIDDAAAARPQSGFNAASIVVQAPADGYESRYEMIFQEGDATDIGPVRSARIYLAQWAAELAGGFAHYGGDRLTLAWIRSTGIHDFTNIDGIGSGNAAYHRISARAAPHNAYTSTADLWRVAAKLGGDPLIDPSVHLRPFRDDGPASARPASQTISIPYRTVKVGYAFDPTTDSYARSLGGSPQVDSMDGQAVSARTVIVLFMSFHTSTTIEPGHNRPVLGYIGTGAGTVYMEGQATKVTWSKASETAPTILTGPDGTELPLVRGRIFIQVVPVGTTVSVEP